MPSFRFRMYDWVLASACALAAVWWVAPHQVPIIVFKCSLVAVATCMAFWVDHSLFKRARDRIEMLDAHAQERDLYASMCMIRRAVIFMACVLGMSLGV